MNKQDIGMLIRVNRIAQNMSIRSFAHFIGIEYSQLSKIERGIESSNEDTIQAIFDGLDIDMTGLDDFLEESRKINSRFLTEVYFFHDITHVEDLKLSLDQLTKDYALSHYALIDYLLYYLAKSDTEKMTKCVQILNEIISFASLQDCQTIYHSLAHYEYLLDHYADAEELIVQADKNFINNRRHALILCQHGLIQMSTGKLFEAHDALSQAKELFESENNLTRSFMCKIYLSEILIAVGKYEDALNTYQELLKLNKTLSISPVFVTRIYVGMFYIYAYQQDFTSFFELYHHLDEKTIDRLKRYSIFYALLIYSLYSTNQIDICKKIIRSYRNIKKGLVDQLMIEYYRLLALNKSNIEFEMTFNKFFIRLDRTPINFYQKNMLKLFLKCLESTQNYPVLYRLSTYILN